MSTMRVKDLMIPLEDYPVVSEEKTRLEALIAIRAAFDDANGRSRARAVLVVDKNRRVVGKIDQLAVLMALEPKCSLARDMDLLRRSGVSAEDLSAMMNNNQLFQDDLESLCLRSGRLSVRDVMRPIEESVEEDSPLTDAIHKLVLGQTLSILVKRQGQVVGLLRLSDLFDTLSTMMLDGGGRS